MEPTESRRLERRLERADAYLERNDLMAARAAYESIHAAGMGFPHVVLCLMRIAELQGRYRDARALACSMVSACHDDAGMIQLVASGLARHGESLAAISLMRQIDPESCADVAILQDLARLSIVLEDAGFARRLLDRVVALQGRSASATYQLGVLDVFSGSLDSAEASFEHCLRLAPGFGQAHLALSRLRRQNTGTNHVDRLRKCLSASTAQNAPSIAFALFKELDDLGEYKDAWAALAEGCRLKRLGLNYRWQDDQAGFRALERLQDEGCFSGEPPTPASGPIPIFIVGLPRSGTTVLERLLSAHPDVQAAGELPDFAMQMRLAGNRYSRSYLDEPLLDAVAKQKGGDLGAQYLQQTQWRARGRAYYVDKMPLNFANVGFIASSVAGAKIIHLHKEPVDACFSNLKEVFTRMYQHTYQLDELAAYHRGYWSLMARWRSCLPATASVIDLSYEDLVTAPAEVMRSILPSIGLPWCDACADLSEGGHSVTTASAVQVREPIHSRAIGQWKNYAEWLGPLIDGLA